jgi:hypothetical protein
MIPVCGSQPERAGSLCCQPARLCLLHAGTATWIDETSGICRGVWRRWRWVAPGAAIWVKYAACFCPEPTHVFECRYRPGRLRAGRARVRSPFRGDAPRCDEQDHKSCQRKLPSQGSGHVGLLSEKAPRKTSMVVPSPLPMSRVPRQRWNNLPDCQLRCLLRLEGLHVETAVT